MQNERQRYPYSFWSNLRFLFGNMFRWSARLTILSMLRAPFMVALPLLGLFLTQRVVALLEAGAELNTIILNAAVLCGAVALCGVADRFLQAQDRAQGTNNMFNYQRDLMFATLHHDYEYCESPAGLDSFTRALADVGNNSGMAQVIRNFSSFAGNLIGLVSYAAVIFLVHPMIFVVILATSTLAYFFLRKVSAWEANNKHNWMVLERKQNYVTQTSGDMDSAKDVRLYNLTGWLQKTFVATVDERGSWAYKYEGYAFRMDIVVGILSLLREGVAYGMLVYMMVTRNMPVADFVLNFGMVAGFAAWFDGIVANLVGFDRMHITTSEVRSYLDQKSVHNHGEGAAAPKGTFSVEFRNVNYQFKGTEKEIFRDFNLKIGKGEKVAIVGMNGAGKTTLVKLLCGLYRPTGGEILVDGRPIDAYNIDDYYGLFSAVFQDISVLPMTVKQNIAVRPDGIDEIRLREALRASGFDEVAAKLEHDLETYLVRGIFPGAVDLSGGEMQKLALARALYKNAPFLILDEPTAALDPIAESRIYEKYNEISGGKSSVFISHRLASTRFCDRILFLEHGKIAEEGTHEELLAKKGKYYELFEIQSHYYKEEVEAV